MIRAAFSAALLALVMTVAPARADSDLDKQRAANAGKITALETAQKQQSEAETDLSNLGDWYALDNCDKTGAQAGAKCPEVRKKIKADQDRIRDLARQIAGLKVQLKDYLAAKAEDDLFQALKTDVTDTTSASKLKRVIDCLDSEGLKSRGLSDLHAQALSLLRALDSGAAYDFVRKTPGFKDRLCGPPVTNECWENTDGRIAYRTKGNMLIDQTCVIHGAGDWSHFPKDPADLVRSADSATSKIGSCLHTLNPDVSQELTTYLQRPQRPRILCDKDGASTKNECAHTSHGTFELTLTHPTDCGRLDNSIFHELLHAGTQLDDMTAVHHNNPACRPYDTIYACSELCLPSAPTLAKAGISWHGCNACVQNEAAKSRCSSLEPTYDNDYLSCKPREQ